MGDAWSNSKGVVSAALPTGIVAHDHRPLSGDVAIAMNGRIEGA
jgi:hypothetical protein